MSVGLKIHVEPLPEGMWADEKLKNDAFVALYQDCYPSLVVLCRRMLCGRGDAEAIAQEAFVRAWCSLDRFTGARPFWPWVATIARRLCIDHRRRLGREATNLHIEASACERRTPPPEELVELDEDHRAAIEALRRLKPAEQRVITLREVNGWSYDEIAQFEGVTVESIRGSLKRARASLRRSYARVAAGAPAALGVSALRSLRGRARRLPRPVVPHAPLVSSLGWAGDVVVGAVALVVAVTGAPAGSSTSFSVMTGAGVVDVTTASAGVSSNEGGPSLVALTGRAPMASGGETPSSGSGSSPPLLPADMLPGDGGATTADVTFTDVTPSPSYGEDGTVFASGVVTSGCPTGTCVAIFRSSDRGASWHRLSAVGFAGGDLLLPPAYPRDPRIFAAGPAGLQVSLDGAASFVGLTLVGGGAAMSPGFSAGDPRILFGAAPGWEYRDDLGAMRPGGFVMSSTATAGSIAFVPTSGGEPLVVVGGTAPGLNGPHTTTVFRCNAALCDTATSFPASIGAAEVAVSPRAVNPLVLAWRGSTVLRSVDGANSFEPVYLPTPGDVRSVAFDAAGRVLIAVRTLSGNTSSGDVLVSSDGGRTWAGVGSGSPLAGGVEVIGATDDGRWFAAPTAGAGGGLLCSTDGGKRWARACS